jgi:polysaccharide biosynthesis/export protein
MKRLSALTILSGVLIFASCKIQQKMPLYLENASQDNIEKNIVVPDLKIQKNDLLAIQVYSDYLPKDANPDPYYNQPTPSGGMPSGGQVTTTSMSGYLVDQNGYITYPRLGLIKAEGLSKEELEAEIKKRLITPIELLKNPIVIIRFQSYKIVALGEFNNPGILNIPTEKVDIFEAISMAGGITEWGRKDQVKVIREQDGKRELGIVDLSSAQIFNSPYYYLKQNDKLLVDPIKLKARLKDENTTLTRTGFIMTFVSAAALIFGIIRSL